MISETSVWFCRIITMIWQNHYYEAENGKARFFAVIDLLEEILSLKSFVFSRKAVPLQAEYYQNCTKSLILSTLLRQVSVVTAHAGIGFLFFRVINLLIFKASGYFKF